MVDDNRPVPSNLQPSPTPDSPAEASNSTAVSENSQASDVQPASTTNTSTEITQGQQDRTDLLARARSFLTSPQIRYEDVQFKRRFLVEKGLSDVEIDALLRELPPQTPLVPPRTYPQPPPSNLPNLILSLFKVFTWIAGGSAAVLLVYYRFLLPRLTRSAQARYSLKSHQKDLLSNLTVSLTSLKAAQSESFSVLPQPMLYKENSRYIDCHTLDEVASVREKGNSHVQDATLLRCAIEEHAKEGKQIGTEELFQFLQSKLSWITPEDWPEHQNSLWETLSGHPLFHHSESEDTLVWSYTPPTPPTPSSFESSLSSLKAVLPGAKRTGSFQHTLQALSDFTGYITTQTYALPNTNSWRTPGLNLGSGMLTPQEEELRREIRALKGLVLNRRSFMPSIPRPTSTPMATPGR